MALAVANREGEPLSVDCLHLAMQNRPPSMQKNWQDMGSREFYNCLKRAIQESTTPPPELTSFLRVPSWPPTAHEIDWMLRQQQYPRYATRYDACADIGDRYVVDDEADAELMPILKEHLPEIYRNNRIPIAPRPHHGIRRTK
jgi:hypothetical protein